MTPQTKIEKDVAVAVTVTVASPELESTSTATSTEPSPSLVSKSSHNPLKVKFGVDNEDKPIALTELVVDVEGEGEWEGCVSAFEKKAYSPKYTPITEGGHELPQGVRSRASFMRVSNDNGSLS